MTVVNPKSISGINSITMASGGDDLLTIHSNNTTERVRVNNSGDVIVGSGVTLSPDGDAFFTGVCTATSFSGDGSNLTGISAGTALSGSTDNTVTTVTGANAITGEANLKFDGSGTLTIVDTELAEASDNFSINIQSGNNDFYVKSGGTIFAAFKGSAKDLQLTSGNLVIGTSGKGIDFSADGNASGSSSEVLDDYEEGTFTPTMANSVTLHSGNDLLSYVKVGHLVHVTGVLRINSDNSNSVFSITNMPFATVNASDQAGNAIGAVSLYDQDMNSGYSQVISVMNPNSTTLNVQNLKQSGNQAPGLTLIANAYIGISICYRAA